MIQLLHDFLRYINRSWRSSIPFEKLTLSKTKKVFSPELQKFLGSIPLGIWEKKLLPQQVKEVDIHQPIFRIFRETFSAGDAKITKTSRYQTTWLVEAVKSKDSTIVEQLLNTHQVNLWPKVQGKTAQEWAFELFAEESNNPALQRILSLLVFSEKP